MEQREVNMKKVGLFISDLITALIGIPIGIGILELFIFTISIIIGQYIRMDCGNLELVIQSYIEAGIFGYGMVWLFIIFNRVIADKEKDHINQTKTIIKASWIIITILALIEGIVSLDLMGALMIASAFSMLFGGALLLVYAYDKKIIKKINKKIKENQNKED